ncbi:PTS sugar transporter subunit IIA [Pseudaminobacter sp. NGMCC 1.201702]|uniref:PTS sugar transporter subunit IIA n=1 Tax=Pseudaminobacter sp. NGMCC 1.201702 TaxID=3391825 RepID=UPI0039EE8737
MLRIAELIRPENIAVDVSATAKRHALLEAAKLLAASSGLPESRIFMALIDRENLGSTGFGRGVAVPHARISGLARTHMAFLRLARPVDFEASDEQPVDLICAIIGNYGAAAEPLEALASACRTLRNPETLAKLRLARNRADLYSVLIEAG